MASLLKRWYKWRYSGIITVPTVVILIFGGIFYLDSLGEFYDKWSCDLLIDYRDKEIKTIEHPMYKDLTLEEQKRYDDLILKDCVFNP